MKNGLLAHYILEILLQKRNLLLRIFYIHLKSFFFVSIFWFLLLRRGFSIFKDLCVASVSTHDKFYAQLLYNCSIAWYSPLPLRNFQQLDKANRDELDIGQDTFNHQDYHFLIQIYFAMITTRTWGVLVDASEEFYTDLKAILVEIY